MSQAVSSSTLFSWSSESVQSLLVGHPVETYRFTRASGWTVSDTQTDTPEQLLLTDNCASATPQFAEARLYTAQVTFAAAGTIGPGTRPLTITVYGKRPGAAAVAIATGTLTAAQRHGTAGLAYTCTVSNTGKAFNLTGALLYVTGQLGSGTASSAEATKCVVSCLVGPRRENIDL